MSEEEAKSFEPTVVLVDDKNRIAEVFAEKHGEIK